MPIIFFKYVYPYRAICFKVNQNYDYFKKNLATNFCTRTRFIVLLCRNLNMIIYFFTGNTRFHIPGDHILHVWTELGVG